MTKEKTDNSFNFWGNLVTGIVCGPIMGLSLAFLIPAPARISTIHAQVQELRKDEDIQLYKGLVEKRVNLDQALAYHTEELQELVENPNVSTYIQLQREEYEINGRRMKSGLYIGGLAGITLAVGASGVSRLIKRNK